MENSFFCGDFFSNPILWKALQDTGAVTPGEEPNWKKMKIVFQSFYKNGLPLNGGYFRQTTLKHYRTSSQKEWCPAPAENATQQALACRLAWRALPEDEVRAFAKDPSRETFREACHKFQLALSGPDGLTSGKYSDYSVKCMLDALLCEGSYLLVTSPRGR